MEQEEERDYEAEEACQHIRRHNEEGSAVCDVLAMQHCLEQVVRRPDHGLTRH